MSETMADFSTELNNSMRVINVGDMVTGTVVGVSDTEVTVDLQYYAEGIIRANDYSGDPSFNIRQDVEIGTEVSAVVLRMDDGHGNILLSRREANEILIWDKLEEMMKEKQEKQKLQERLNMLICRRDYFSLKHLIKDYKL